MPYDPNIPQAGTEIDAVQMRGQLNGLKDLIDAVPTITSAQVDGVTTLPAGDPATVSASVTGAVLHLTFGIPQGQEGQAGPPGEVTTAALDAAISGTSNNSNGVAALAESADSSYNQPQIQNLLNKMDELINALRR
jgi:hypothetical protein